LPCFRKHLYQCFALIDELDVSLVLFSILILSVFSRKNKKLKSIRKRAKDTTPAINLIHQLAQNTDKDACGSTAMFIYEVLTHKHYDYPSMTFGGTRIAIKGRNLSDVMLDVKTQVNLEKVVWVAIKRDHNIILVKDTRPLATTTYVLQSFANSFTFKDWMNHAPNGGSYLTIDQIVSRLQTIVDPGALITAKRAAMYALFAPALFHTPTKTNAQILADIDVWFGNNPAHISFQTDVFGTAPFAFAMGGLIYADIAPDFYAEVDLSKVMTDNCKAKKFFEGK